MRVETEPADYERVAAGTITVFALKRNRRPVGYAPWPDLAAPVPETKKRKRKKGKR